MPSALAPALDVVLTWHREPITSVRRYAWDGAVLTAMLVPACALFDVGWQLIPLMVVGRGVVLAVARLRQRTQSAP